MTSRPGPAFRRLCILTASATYLLIVAGGVVRVTGSGLGCGRSNDWPLCEGGLLPPLRQDALIEFTHRWLAATATGLVVALATVAWLRYRRARRIVWPVTVAVVLFAVQVVLGALTVKLDLPGGVILLHLANAMLLLGVLVQITFTAWTEGSPRRRGTTGGVPGRLAPLTAASAYVLALSGALVVSQQAGLACSAWPLCGNGLQVPHERYALLNLGHRVVAAAVIVLVGLTVMSARRSMPSDLGLRILGIVTSLLLLAQVVAGALVVELRLPAAIRGVHLALASALWAATLLLALFVRTATGVPAEDSRRRARAEPQATAAPS